MPSRVARAKTKSSGSIQDRYFELVREFPFRPLRSSADLDAAVAMIDQLLDQPKLSAVEQDFLDVLSNLVEEYEDATMVIPRVGDATLLRFLIEQHQVTQVAVARGAGVAESTISDVLSGRRKLNRQQIVKLAKYFHVEPAVFLSTT